MIDELVTAYGNRFLVAALGVSLALLCLFIVLWLLRNRAPSPFVRGGRNRQPRLQVLDAAAVDARRRLVLVRRDNVEHLVMIGGPTDIVIESGIGDERAYLSATPVGGAAMQVTGDAAETRLPTPAVVPRALEQRESPPAPVAKPEPSVAARPAAPSAAATAPPQATFSTPPPPRPPVRPAMVQEAQPQPTARVEPRAIEAPRQDVTQPAAGGPERAYRITESLEAERPVAPSAPAPSPAAPPSASPVAAARPTAEIAPPSSPTSENRFAPAVPPLGPANETRKMETSASSAAPVAAAAVIAPSIGAPALGLSKPAAEETTIPQSNAADILEAARQRVLSPAAETPPLVRPSGPPSAPTEVPEQNREPSDFERVLEEEMALHLAASEVPAKAPAAFEPILPETRADRPVVPPIAAPIRSDESRPSATTAEEPDLQDEIARIFGEMSADRR